MATAAPFLARVVAGQTRSTTGNTSYTSPGIGTPSAALVIACYGTGNDAYANHASMSWGITDGTNQFCVSNWSRDNTSPSVSKASGSTSKVLRIFNPATSAVQVAATFNAWVTDGIQLNFGTASLSQFRMIVVLFSGTQCSAIAGQDTPNASGGGAKKVTTGFAQDVVLTNRMPNTDESTAADCYHQPGFATRTSTKQGFTGHMASDAQATTRTVRITRSDCVAQNFTINAGAPTNLSQTTLNNHVSDGFDITTANSGTGPTIAYLALKVTGTVTVGAVMTTGRATPGSTGNEAATWPGHPTGFLMCVANLAITINSGQGQGAAGSIGVSDGRTHLSSIILDDDNIATTNTASRHSTKPFESPLSTQAASADATWVSRDSTGYTLNFANTPGTATLYDALSIEETVQVVSPTGIASGEAIGTPYVRATIGPTGIASAQALGTPTVVRGAVTVSPSGIASAEAFGTATVQRGTVTISPSGIASGQALGTPTVQRGTVTVSPSGIASAEAFGTATVAATYTVSPSGIASAEAFGTPTVAATYTVSPSGIASAEAFGTPTVQRGAVTVSPSGIASGEAFGSATIQATITVSPSGIASGEAFGTVTVVGGSSTIAPPSIPSAEAFGTPNIVGGAVTVTPPSIPSAEAFGSPNVHATIVVLPAGIASGQAVGTPTVLRGAVTIIPSGIASGEAFGNLTVLLAGSGIVLVPTGIPSSEAFGRPFIRGGLIPTTMKKKVYDALCEAAHQGMFLAATYDSETGCTLVQGLQVMPASVEANEISGSYEIARQYGRDFAQDNLQWQWLLILRFQGEVITELFEQAMLKNPICIKRDYSDPESRQIRLLMLDSKYEHPPREGASNGSEVRMRFAAQLTRIK